MSMPDEISKLVHNFLRGGNWRKRIYNAKQKWIEKNSSFKIGELYTPPFKSVYYKVIKVGAMITFECNGEVFRRKPKFMDERTVYEGDCDSHIQPAHWYVEMPDKLTLCSSDVHFRFQTILWRDYPDKIKSKPYKPTFIPKRKLISGV